MRELDPCNDYKWTYDEEKTYWFVHEKGALVFLYIDRFIQENTNNEKDIYDFLDLHLYKMKKENERGYGLMEKTIEELIGKKFEGFFEKHVLDNKPLPIKVINDEIVIED